MFVICDRTVYYILKDSNLFCGGCLPSVRTYSVMFLNVWSFIGVDVDFVQICLVNNSDKGNQYILCTPTTRGIILKISVSVWPSIQLHLR